MTMTATPPVTVTRLATQILADESRVITRPFSPGNTERIPRIIERVLSLAPDDVERVLARVMRDFGGRHRTFRSVLRRHYEEVALPHVPEPAALSESQELLIGSYFTKEYSLEAAALFNPSIVPHPDQTRVPHGGLRFIMSLRATGEGHISSVAFRTGVIDRDGKITVHRVGQHVMPAEKVKDRVYHKHTFLLKLIEMGSYDELAGAILERLGERFVYGDLLRAIEELGATLAEPEALQGTAESMRWLARSNYHLDFPEDGDVSDVVIFPVSENETAGIEDARFVRFVDDDGAVMYYGTYTAYNGVRILPMLIETADFRHFRINTLNGVYAQNKGHALFPRRIGGWYMMVSRVDGENLYMMASDNVRFWNEAQVLQTPLFPWEFVQVGNCGSPLETDAGWLLLTHGVGPVRQYCIGATLLDLEDPTRVIAQTPEPILVPNEREREGYVPNVVYTCGAMIHRDTLILPYAMSDSATSLATIPVSELLDYLKSG